MKTPKLKIEQMKLVSQPYSKESAQPVKFVLTGLGAELLESTAIRNDVDGSVHLQFDLDTIPDGEYTVKVIADGNGRQSEPSKLRVNISKTPVKPELSIEA